MAVPDPDGGYSLVGLRRPVPGLFDHGMSHAGVLAQTLAAAQAAGLDFDQVIQTVLAPADQLPKQMMFIPALLVLGLIIVMQRGRRRRQLATAAA